MKVLVACEFSGTVRDAFRNKGHDAWSCDLLPSYDNTHHIIGDVIEYIDEKWDLMIAHPPCTFLCNSGVCHLHTDKTRWNKMEYGAKFFKTLWSAPIKKKCIENPIMHKYAKKIIGATQSQIIQPYHFGHLESKATCLWLSNLPLLLPTNNVKDEMMKLPKNKRERLHYLPPSPDRWKLRSMTYEGIAVAMADQWG